MEGDVNKCILVGRVTRDPEIRPTKTGVTQAYFPLSTTESWYDKATNQKRTKTVFHRVVVYGDALVRVVDKCVHKGARLYLEGQIEIRKWVGKDGQSTESWTCEVVVQGWSGRLTVLDFSDGPARPEPADAEDDLGDSPTPLSIKRSAGKYGDDAIDPNLSFMKEQSQ